MTTSLAGRDIISLSRLGNGQIKKIFDLARDFRRMFDRCHALPPLMAEKVLALIFDQPSTRTYGSTGIAMVRLGGLLAPPFIAASVASSLAKGETFEDMGSSLSEMTVDVIAMRHKKVGSAQRLANGASIPVINCGDGTGKHPTQALLDVFTASRSIGILDSCTVTLLGDLKNGRTVHENGPLFGRFGVQRFFLVSPPLLAMPKRIVTQMERHGTTIIQTQDLEAALKESDLVYATRIQREYFESEEEYDAVRGSYVVDAALLQRTNPNVKVMHPLPRVDELATDIDKLPNALYWEQMRNGVFVRAAILALITGAI